MASKQIIQNNVTMIMCKFVVVVVVVHVPDFLFANPYPMLHMSNY